MKQTKLEVISINEDVITTSGKIKFNTIQFLGAGSYAAYNISDYSSDADGNAILSSAEGIFTVEDWIKTQGTPNITSEDVLTYNGILTNNTHINSYAAYHYINGAWVICDHVGVEHQIVGG